MRPQDRLFELAGAAVPLAVAPQSSATMQEVPDLASVSTAFVDSSAALAYAKKLGLPPAAQVRSLSPAMVLQGPNGVEAAGRHLSAADVAEFGPASMRFSMEVFDALRESAAFADAAISIAQLGIKFPSLVRIAMNLEARHFVEPVAVIQAEPTGSAFEGQYAVPWSKVLSPNPALVVVSAPVEAGALAKLHRTERTSFLERQRLGGWEKIGFQLLRGLWDRLPFASPRGTFLILIDNLLLRETALHLMQRGFGVRYLPRVTGQFESLSGDEKRQLRQLISGAIGRFLGGRVVAAAKSNLAAIFEEQAIVAIESFRGALGVWDREIKGLAGVKPQAVLSNMMMRPEMAALQLVCTRHNIPVAAFQHGVAREIGSFNQYIQAYFEGNTADYFYAYNPAAARVSESCYFNRAAAVSVGLPVTHVRAGSVGTRKAARPPILYASTQLYTAGFNMAAIRSYSDTDIATAEIALIDRVFARLPHDLLFKPYPELRYLDPDPVLDRAKKAANITIFPHGDDLRFLLSYFRIVVTSRASSTLGWCAASGKPLVYIDYPSQKPLWPDARDAFDAGFFIFDGGSPDMHEQLRDFLSQPIERIESQWAERRSAREAVLAEFVGAADGKAGRRAAAHLAAAIRAKHTGGGPRGAALPPNDLR